MLYLFGFDRIGVAVSDIYRARLRRGRPGQTVAAVSDGQPRGLLGNVAFHVEVRQKNRCARR